MSTIVDESIEKKEITKSISWLSKIHELAETNELTLEFLCEHSHVKWMCVEPYRDNPIFMCMCHPELIQNSLYYYCSPDDYTKYTTEVHSTFYVSIFKQTGRFGLMWDPSPGELGSICNMRNEDYPGIVPIVECLFKGKQEG